MKPQTNHSHLKERKTHAIHISTESGLFDNFDEALKAADTLKNYIGRISKTNGYHCIGIIGVSHHDSDFGEISTNKFGKHEFEPWLPGGYVKEVPPHLHILLIANPASTLKNVIYEYFHKKYKRKVTYEECVDEYCERTIHYVIRQSRRVRTVDLFSDELNPWATCFIHSASVKYCLNGNKKRLFPKYDYNAITQNFFALINDASKFNIPFDFGHFFNECKRLSFLKPQTAKLRKYDLWNDYAEERMNEANWF